MFAHRANPLVNRGGGVVEWTPFRERKTHGTMYWKGSEILGYFDEPKKIWKEGDEVDVAFRWSSSGETLDEICPARDATEIDCEKCQKDYLNITGEKHIYHEVRCFSGTGDFRVALVDFSRSRHGLGQIDKDGYGYYNKAMIEARGVQWRFHPHACPRTPREKPGGYAATSASSWIRSNIKPFEINSRGLVCDFIEDDLNGKRSFKERLFDPADDGSCLALPTGEWTPQKSPLRLKLEVLKVITDKEDLPGNYISSEAEEDEIEETGPWITFRWTMGFNGWRASRTDTWHSDVFPHQIDAVAIGYTNPRSFTSLKLKYLKYFPYDNDIPNYRSAIPEEER